MDVTRSVVVFPILLPPFVLSFLYKRIPRVYTYVFFCIYVFFYTYHYLLLLPPTRPFVFFSVHLYIRDLVAR